MNIRPVSEISKKYNERSMQSGAYYEAGVRDTTVDWATATAEAADAFKKGIDKAETALLFKLIIPHCKTICQPPRQGEKEKSHGISSFNASKRHKV